MRISARYQIVPIRSNSLNNNEMQEAKHIKSASDTTKIHDSLVRLVRPMLGGQRTNIAEESGRIVESGKVATFVMNWKHVRGTHLVMCRMRKHTVVLHKRSTFR